MKRYTSVVWMSGVRREKATYHACLVIAHSIHLSFHAHIIALLRRSVKNRFVAFASLQFHVRRSEENRWQPTLLYKAVRRERLFKKGSLSYKLCRELCRYLQTSFVEQWPETKNYEARDKARDEVYKEGFKD